MDAIFFLSHSFAARLLTDTLLLFVICLSDLLSFLLLTFRVSYMLIVLYTLIPFESSIHKATTRHFHPSCSCIYSPLCYLALFPLIIHLLSLLLYLQLLLLQHKSCPTPLSSHIPYVNLRESLPTAASPSLLTLPLHLIAC